MKTTNDDLWGLLGTLHQDFNQAFTNFHKEQTPYNRRAYVRAAFAAMEAITFFLKREALCRRPEIFSHAEKTLLSEESYSLDNKRNAEVQPKFLPLDRNYVFAMQMFSRAMKSLFVLEKRTEWEALKKAIQVRNRITHPKRPELLEVSDQELEDVVTAYRWVVMSTVSCISEAASALTSEVKKIAEEHGINV